MDFIRPVLNAIQTAIAWLPEDLVAGLILVFAVLIALTLHKSFRKVLRRTLEKQHPYALSIFTQMRGVSRLGLLIVAMFIALPLAPFDSETATWLARMLLIAIIALIGWTAMTALTISADLYLMQFSLDTEDNLLARKHITQVQVLLRAADVLVVVVTFGAALMTFEPVRQYGVSLFASAGVAGLVAGLAARPVLSNLFAGVQLAMTQPSASTIPSWSRMSWGRIEEITATYVVVRLWDLRRMILPLSYFIEKPFQNWTRESSELIGTALFYLDYRAPIGIIRKKLEEIVHGSPSWNGDVVKLQVTDTKAEQIEVRAIMSANSAGQAFDLRCEVREKLIDFLQNEHPEALPHSRQISFSGGGKPARKSTKSKSKAR